MSKQKEYDIYLLIAGQSTSSINTKFVNRFHESNSRIGLFCTSASILVVGQYSSCNSRVESAVDIRIP